jgi:gliding motility-associated-like protein
VTNATVCNGSPTTLSVSGGTSYTWTPSTGLSATSGNSVTATVNSSAIYTITGSSSGTCSATTTATVTVNPLPNISVNNAAICTGQQSATLTASGASTYTWSPATGLSSTTGGTVIGTPPNPPQNYTVTGTDLNGCVNTATTSIAGNSLPPLTVNSSIICTGQQTGTLTVSGASTYTWSPAMSLSSPTGSVVKANPTATQNYTVTGTDANGCVNTGTTSVTVNPLPIITVSSASICAGQQTATLTAGGASSYSWTPVTNLTPSTGSIVMATPSSSQNYTVTGTDANGCINKGAGNITVFTLPTVTSTSTSICLGSSGTVTAGGASTYTWNTGATGSAFTVIPIATGNYTVSGTDINSCTNTAVGTITVYPSLTVTVNNASICAGQQTATLTADGAVNYVWNPTTGLTPATGSMVVANPNTTTIYTVTGSVGSCSATAISTVTVNPLPIPTATANTPCLSQQALNLSCTLNGMQNYNWTGPNSFVASGQNQSIAAANLVLANEGKYNVVVTDNNSCTNMATVLVNINQKPAITAIGATVCVGQTINLSSNGAGTGTYNWSGPSTYSYTSTSQNPSITNAAPIMDGIYSVIGTDANGCQNATFASVQVNNLPAIIASSYTICSGEQTATLTAGGAGVAGTYSWSPSTGLSTNTGSVITGTPSTTQVYTVMGTEANGCANYTTTYVLVDSLPLITVNSASICLGQQTATLTAGGANTYTWSPPVGLSASTGNVVISTPPATQNYTVTGTNVNGCVNKETTAVVVYTIPIPDFNYAHQPVSMLDPKVYFENQSNGIITSYNWSFGDIYANNDTSSVRNPMYTYADTGTYDVTLSIISANGCFASVVKPVIINADYTLYVPNAFTPNGDGTNEVFKASGEGITDFKMYIFDRWGLLIFYTDNINTGWNGHYQGKGTDVVQQDVYVWKIEASDFNNIPKNLQGTVTLLK